MSDMEHTIESGARAEPRTARRRPSLGSLGVIVFTAVAGLLLGYQIFKPTKRVIEGIVGLILILISWNVSGFYTLLFLIVAYPFPFALSLGNSDFIFILIVFIISLARSRTGLFKFRSSKPLNIPIALMVLSFFFSFYNVDYAGGEFKLNLIATFPLLTSVMLFYLCVSYIDSEERMQKALNAVVISAAFVSLFTLLELMFPRMVLVPNWLVTQHKAVLVAKGLRMMGPFHDYELLAEFFAINLLLILLCLVRSKRLLVRAAYAALLLVDLFLMFSTITRGAIIILAIGSIYLAFISRRELHFVRLTMIAGALILLVVMIDAFVTRYTSSGSLLARLFATTFKRGIIPENRYYTWSFGLVRGMETPFIGHGPAFDYSKGVQLRLIPHSIYMYLFDLTGLFGLSAFIFFMYRLMRMSAKSIAVSLKSSPLPQAFLKVLHVCLIMFLIDQIKVEYLRNNIYTYFVWLLFGLTAANYSIMQERAKAEQLSAPSP